MNDYILEGERMKALDKRIASWVWSRATNLVNKGHHENEKMILEAVEEIINAAVEEGAHATEDFVNTVYDEFEKQTEAELEFKAIRDQRRLQGRRYPNQKRW